MATEQAPPETPLITDQREDAGAAATPRAPSSGTRHWVKEAIAFSERMDQDESFRQAVAGRAS